MKSKIKKLLFVVASSVLMLSCSGSDSEVINRNERQLIGTWEYRITPHPSGMGGPSSFYRTYITLNEDETGLNGFEENITPTEQYSDSEMFTWSATSSTIKRILIDGTEEEGRYELIDATHLRLYGSDGTQYSVDGIPIVFTKQ
jgi:hypothetical protein